MFNPEFSPLPGPHERHLKRRLLNPLFPQPEREITQQDINEACDKDEEMLLSFMEHFKNVVQRATDLEPSSDSEVVLEIKEQLDECFSISCAMPGDQQNIQLAVARLIDAIMSAVRKGAENDPIALQKLEEEDEARAMHNNLLQVKLIADIMLQDSPIAENELTPTLLNESEDSLDAALQLFNLQQLEHIYKDAKLLLEKLRGDGHEIPEAWQRFNQVKAALAEAQNEAGLDSGESE